MPLEHANLLKLWLAHHRRVSRLQDVQKSLNSLMVHYKLECIQKNSKSITTLSLINDAVAEMETLLDQKLTSEDVNVPDYSNQEQEKLADVVNQQEVKGRPVTLAERLESLNSNHDAMQVNANTMSKSMAVNHNLPDDLTNYRKSAF
ncbi:hypothetical protein HNW13_017995 [Shewanella sp. BF02_Schw]|uniref:hypothetical protein n=1 Tax=Shewanella sp. BF02_Schw TaxID=394908 RepID=UPI001781C12C|nr:hypothetical protein [Shewanella sp. BF02_Schw]MBO1897632.1 hypothetical protein [Shewanella sp. BF02_Schw]